jgi:hypothetical protein
MEGRHCSREVVAKLEDAGLEREQLPSNIDGGLDYEQFVDDWLRSKGLLDQYNTHIDEQRRARLEARRRQRHAHSVRRKPERTRLEEAFYNIQATDLRSRKLQTREEKKRVHFDKLAVAKFEDTNGS